jgi:hypothetical protein
MVKKQNLPLVSRVILAAHEALLSGSEDGYKTPGYYRKQSVRVGELVPAPALEVLRLMGALVRQVKPGVSNGCNSHTGKD